MGVSCDPSHIQIRLGRQEDIPAIVEIEQIAFAKELIPPLDVETIRQRLMAMDRFFMLVAEIVAETKSLTVGHALAYPRYNSLYLWSAAVRPDCQRQGIMTEILRRLTDIARGEGFHSITFDTSVKSVGMLMLGLKAGFEIIGFNSKHWLDSEGNWTASVTLEKIL